MKRFVLWALATLMALTLSNAMAADVQLGAGDVIKVTVYNNPDLALETRISESGSITFPLIGAVKVGGMGVSEAEKKLSGLLQSGGFVRQAQVNIIVTVQQSQQASVLGQVNRPGRYPVDGKRSVLEVLALAGGVSAEGGDALVLLRKHDGKTTREVIDLLDMVRAGDLQHDVDLQADDVIYVERAPRFYIYGEVQRPGPVRLERDMTILQALSAGGGLTPRGTERGIRIKRRDASGKIEIISAKQDDVVRMDDVVYVQESLF
ncbi:polysaccharide export protein EpsE [Rugamonas sp.]|uniref:polysaccharide export protein EpsE n=1 Tax=Rugamonas sp. TaxID=1926287 RepID=UPI0025EECFB4|nr:polysaccharide export protein EpsE [Rugamonas sp.]